MKTVLLATCLLVFQASTLQSKMRALACLLFIALAYGIRGSPDLHKDAPVGKFPYQVLLRYDGGYKDCGGSILNNRNILTSAGCLEVVKEDNLDKLKAHVGTNFLSMPGDVYDVVNVTKHENYFENDIALIHLKTPIKYKKQVKPINIMTTDEDLDGNPCTLTGWAKTSTFNALNRLQEVEMIVSELNTCWLQGDFVRDLATTKKFCALTIEEEGAYLYNIGSPLVSKMTGYQIGILTFNVRRRPDVTLPAPYPLRNPYFKVFTRVSYFAAWITAHLKN